MSSGAPYLPDDAVCSGGVDTVAGLSTFGADPFIHLDTLRGTPETDPGVTTQSWVEPVDRGVPPGAGISHVSNHLV